MAEEVNEMGLLDAFNYEAEQPQGYIDEPKDQPLTQENTKKKKTKSDGQASHVVDVNNNNNNNNNNNSERTKLSQCQKYCVDIFYWIHYEIYVYRWCCFIYFTNH